MLNRLKLIGCLLLLSSLSLSCAAGAGEEVRVHRNVPYTDTGEVKQEADIYVPPEEGPFPGVLMIHGGAWTTGSKSHMLAHARTVAEAGYTVVSINYRLAPRHKFPAQIADCKAAVRWMRTHAGKYKIDPQRIAAYGYSAGGHLACLLGTTGPNDRLEGGEVPDDAPATRLQCVVAGGAPCEFRTIPEGVKALAYWLGGSRAEKPEAYRRASPTNFATRDDPPVFFFHGEEDRLVPRDSPKTLQAALTARGVACEFYVVPGKGHIGAFLDRRPQERAVAFLDRVLKATDDEATGE